jgi:hypothetical protein
MKTKKKFQSRHPKLKAALDVGSLIDELAKLPRDMPIGTGFDEGVKPVVFNESDDGVGVLSLEENDGTWDDDDEPPAKTCVWCGESGAVVSESEGWECEDFDACNARINAKTERRVQAQKAER